MLNALYVDDEPDIREIALLALELDPTIDAKIAEGGAQALALLMDESWIADVVILDLMMPGVDGLTFLPLLRGLRAYERTPVIFLTARTGAADVNRLMEAGARGVITKPFDPMTLAQDVKRHLEA